MTNLRPIGAAVRRKPDLASDFLLALLLDFRWVTRRVEHVRWLDMERLEHRVSIDVDCERLMRDARKIKASVDSNVADVPNDFGRLNPFGKSHGQGFYLPLFFVKKGLMFDVDLQHRERRGSLVDSGHVEGLALRIIQACLQKKPSKFHYGNLDRDIRGKIKELIGVRPEAKRGSKISFEGKGALSAMWDELCGFSDFRLLIDRFKNHFLILSWVELDSPAQVFKFRYVEPLTFRSQPSSDERDGRSDYLFEVQLNAVGISQREHLVVHAPTGTFITRTYLTYDDDGEWPATPRGKQGKYQRRISVDMASIYTRNMAPANYTAVIGLYPRSSSFYVPALCAAILSTTLLLLGAIAELVSLVFGLQLKLDSSSATAVLALVPSFAAAFVIRSEDHGLVKRLLTVPRIVYFVSASLSVLTAGAIAAGANGWSLLIIFGAAFGGSSWVVNYLARRIASINKARKKRRNTSAELITRNGSDTETAHAFLLPSDVDMSIALQAKAR